jgi:hypothetical protein
MMILIYTCFFLIIYNFSKKMELRVRPPFSSKSLNIRYQEVICTSPFVMGLFY